MKTTTETATSFQSAVLSVLTADDGQWPEAVIYAEEIDGEMRFDACNFPAMPSDGIVWMYVEADSFGELSGDAESDAGWIAANMYDQAAADTLDEIDRA